MFRTTAMVHLTNRRQALSALQRAEARRFYIKISTLAALALGLVSFVGTSTSETSLRRQLPETQASQWAITKHVGKSQDNITKRGPRKLSVTSGGCITYTKTGFWSSSVKTINILDMKGLKMEGKNITFQANKKWYKLVFNTEKDCEAAHSEMKASISWLTEEVKDIKNVFVKAMNSTGYGAHLWEEIHFKKYNALNDEQMGNALRQNFFLNNMLTGLFQESGHKWLEQIGFRNHYRDEIKKICEQEEVKKIIKEMRKEMRTLMALKKQEPDDYARLNKLRSDLKNMNARHAMSAIESIIKHLDDNKKTLPVCIQTLLAGMHAALQRKHKTHTVRQLGGFLFLRLINPICREELKFNQNTTGGTDDPERQFKLKIFQVMQKISNGIGSKSGGASKLPYMDPKTDVGKHYLKIKNQIATFLTSAATNINVSQEWKACPKESELIEKICDDDYPVKKETPAYEWILRSVAAETK